MRKTFDPAKMCGAHRRSSDEKGPGHKGDPCRHPKGYRTDHRGSGFCTYHGGSGPSGDAHAAREAARKALERLGEPVATDPQRALMHMVAVSAGRLQALAHQYDKAVDGSRAADAAAVAELWDDERDRMVRTAKITVEAGIAERQQKLSEEMARYIWRVVVAALGAVELSAAQRRLATQAAVDELHVIDAQVPTGAALS